MEPSAPAVGEPPPLPHRALRYTSAARLAWLQQAIFLVGLPVEARQTERVARLWALPLLVIAFTAVSFAAWGWPSALEGWYPLAYFPEGEGWRYWSGLIAYPFLHADGAHLFGNLYFVLIFGDNIENRFGGRRLLGIFFLSSIAGAWLHGLFVPNPLIGASGGALGLVVFYAFMFPHARILWLPLGLLGRTVFWAVARPWMHRGFPVWFYLVVCVGLDLLFVSDQLSGDSDISALAHLGGAGMGALLAWAWRRGWIP